MADLATLAIKVDGSDIPKATTSLEGLEVASSKTEAATQRLTRRMALLELEARKMDAEMRDAGNASRYLTREMALAELEARKMDAAMSGVGGVSAKFARSLGISEAAATRLTSALGALSAIAAIGFIGRKTVEETEAAQAAMAQLQAAVTSTGGAAGRTVDQLDALSVSLQKQTTFSDEAVKGAEAMLLTFDKIRGAEFDRATAAVTDLAARMGGDLQSAAVQVGKALQDPEHGLTALRRSGVSFSESQVEVIKNLYATGRAAEGQRVILAELEHQFGGSAKAARDTLGGALAALKNAWGDLFEVSRGASQGTVSAINAITTALQGSNLTMNKILHDATVDWETMRASIEKVRAILGLEINSKFLENARNIIQRIDFDLSAKIADLNKAAPTAPVGAPPPPSGDADAGLKARKKLMDELTDAARDLERAQLDANIAAAKSHAEAVASITEELTASQLLLDAASQGEDAYKAQQREIEVLNRLTAAHISLADDDYEAQRRAVEQTLNNRDATDALAAARKRAEDEAQRDMERRAKELHRTVSSTIEGILTDIDNRRNPFVALFDNLKRGAIKAISDILASKIEGKVADFLGIQTPANKVEKGGQLINQGADKILEAAHLLNGDIGSTTGTGTGAVQQSATMQYLQKFAKVAGAGYGGFQTGYGIGSATGSKTIGGVGGAVSGFMLGNALLPGLGGIVGGAAGFVGGLLGAANSAKEAAARMEQARKDFKRAMDSIVADINGDELAKQIAGVGDQFDQLRKLFMQANVSDAIFNPKRFREGWDDINALQDEYLEKVKREIEFKAQSQIEGYRERELRAQGKTAEADELSRQQERAALIESFGKEIDAREASVLAALDAAQSAEKLAQASNKAADALNTVVRNAPTGFKLEGYIQQFAKGSPLTAPLNPLIPSARPLFNTGSATGTVATAPITITGGITITVQEAQTPELTTKAIAAGFLQEVDAFLAQSSGLNGSRADALNRMPTPSSPSLYRRTI